ncbi:uncharacterized protein PGTG_09176 [Puccinia graminis f. sp. tritici CRL 75-36-700-3]|uniref:Uncharacterized protein n=1 Tax=Puccinia graminis f. sp. tritici (strain CRL 75-36-700-3 / race SCCL) TaxID=418459 RepID=E3KFT8_PUCGT|nr:uncharacterized protein PGTG_09176 [Puccinia graminis f. sp. tritici CRL 75-36-700-3]EFP83223.1 hypothetical protein PGTG_09176 [Puccinia graminis f. sp. tritici CRL 75-36-700-3]
MLAGSVNDDSMQGWKIALNHSGYRLLAFTSIDDEILFSIKKQEWADMQQTGGQVSQSQRHTAASRAQAKHSGHSGSLRVEFFWVAIRKLFLKNPSISSP